MTFHVPAYCRTCQIIFPSGIALGGGNVNTTLTGNISQCLRCGQMAPAISGTFDFLNNVLTIKSASPESLAILRVIQSAWHAAQAGKAEDVVLAEIAGKAPDLAEKLVQRPPKMSLAAVLMMLLLAGCSSQAKLDVKLDLNRLFDQAYTMWTGGATANRGTEPPSTQEATPKENRQQRRYQERQRKKLESQRARQTRREPK